MKIVFKVCCGADERNITSTTMRPSYVTPFTSHSWPMRPYSRIPPTTSSTTPHYVTRTETTSTRKPTKKIGKLFYFINCNYMIINFFLIVVEYDKHPNENEVLKNEELHYSRGVWLSAGPPSFLVVAACIAAVRWRWARGRRASQPAFQHGIRYVDTYL